jgi:hypothetical protein
MKTRFSLAACFIVLAVLLCFRFATISAGKPLKITTWDAFGYYMYLPATIIYHDFNKLDWVPNIDNQYAVTGGDGVQAEKAENGNYVFKYLGGVAILQLPFFLYAHCATNFCGCPADGFSSMYQYALSFGVILYCFLSLLLLRFILLKYFRDKVVGSTILLLCLASNFTVYAAMDNGMSHAWIFPLYVLQLFITIRWHERPRMFTAFMIGWIIGLATICRPTEAIMLFIPLLWNTHTKEEARMKWQLVRLNKSHPVIAAFGGLIGILPQLIYWKLSCGSWIYSQGSRWDFLNPHFRVLFGWEKGWFIYTPVTILFVLGLFFIKKFPFRKSVIWFCLLNIWIIIAWHEWWYGASYSTRALVQSYPVFALPLASFIDKAVSGKWRFAFYIVGLYMVFANLFQAWQYSTGVLHYEDMNRRYYSRIYLNPHPTPLDMSLLDTKDFLYNESSYRKTRVANIDTVIKLEFPGESSKEILSLDIPANGDRWFKIEATVYAPDHLWKSYLKASVSSADTSKEVEIRLFMPLVENGMDNQYQFYFHLTPADKGPIRVFLQSEYGFRGEVRNLRISKLEKQI